MQCSKCHIARFCGAECVRLMWPTHKGSCKVWQREQAGAAGSSDWPQRPGSATARPFTTVMGSSPPPASSLSLLTFTVRIRSE
jgi:hypothetical protein